jgi:hypothetical protein
MSNSNRREFRQLFASVWSTFKSNYLLCLGMMVPVVLLVLIMAVGRIGAGIWFTGDESDVLAGQIASIAIWFLFSSLVVIPLVAQLLYRIVRRVRQGPEACAGRYVQLAVLVLIGHACLLPGAVIIAASDPNQYVEMKLAWNLLTDGVKEGMQGAMDPEAAAYADENQTTEQDAPAGPQNEMAVIQDSKRQLDVVRSSRNNGLQIVGVLAMLAGGVFLLTWLPWSIMASLDPKENKSDVQSAIRRGREIAAGNLWPIVGVYIIVIFIAAASSACLLLPGFFFGIPLALAMVPGLYMCLRGELEHIDT